VLGAGPRTRLCGVVIVLAAAAAAVVQPANIFGRTLPMERPASAGLKLWAIALDGRAERRCNRHCSTPSHTMASTRS
jgi:hypothetical protein